MKLLAFSIIFSFDVVYNTVFTRQQTIQYTFFLETCGKLLGKMFDIDYYRMKNCKR